MSAETGALAAAVLLEEAQRQTGLEDLGGDSVLEGLGVYCDALASQAKLNDLGVAALPTIVLTNLTNRLRVVEHLERNPQVADEPIEAPVVVIGLFRAGSTLLSQLLDLDPGARSLLGWESQDSVPPPTPATTGRVAAPRHRPRRPRRCLSRRPPRVPPLRPCHGRGIGVQPHPDALGTFSDADHREYIATRWTHVLRESVDRVEDFRRRHPDHPVLDLHYQQLVTEPLGAVAQVYEFTGRTLDERTATLMHEHLAANPKGGRGAHRYDPADFGLDEDELRSTFAAYVERHEVAPER